MEGCPSPLIYKSGLNCINYSFSPVVLWFSLPLPLCLSHSIFPLLSVYCKYCLHHRCSTTFGPTDRPPWYTRCIYKRDCSPLFIFPLLFHSSSLYSRPTGQLPYMRPAPAQGFLLLKKILSPYHLCLLGGGQTLLKSATGQFNSDRQIISWKYRKF